MPTFANLRLIFVSSSTADWPQSCWFKFYLQLCVSVGDLLWPGTFPPPVTHWGSIEDGATRWPICYQLLLVQRSWWWWWWVSGVTPGHLPHLAQTHLVTTSWCQQPLVTKASEAGVEMLLNLLYSAKLHKSEEIIVLRTRAWSSISTTHC